MANLDFIYNRKSVRLFKDEPVKREDIVEIIKAGTYAPSAKNSQNWHFVVLQNKELINTLADVVAVSHENIAKLAKDEMDYKLHMRFLKYYTAFKNAPVVVLVYGTTTRMLEHKILEDNEAAKEIVEQLTSAHSDAQNIGAAVENMLLAATALGYGSCYMTGPTHAKNKIEEVIGFDKEGYGLMSMVCLGVAADKTPKQPPRKPVEEVVTFID